MAYFVIRYIHITYTLTIFIFNFGKVPQVSTKRAFSMAFSIDQGIQKCMWNLCLTLPLYEIQHQNLTFYEAKIWTFLGLSQILPKFQNSKCHFVKTNRNNEKMTLDQSIRFTNSIHKPNINLNWKLIIAYPWPTVPSFTGD